ncbi:MAG: RHS repeat-associated core domain-containing protein [Actinomycetota bacterium]|nr:RHS repeat-associated core domain-containing protein [Actinomycetota bacterium]
MPGTRARQGERGSNGPEATAISRQPLRYASYAFDEHSGLYYLSQRYYDPATMQFISKDPARADREESAYQYCAGEPVGKVDPSGEYTQALWARWIPSYKIHSWVLRQVLYAMATQYAASAASSRLWGYCATRVQATAVTRAARGLINKVGTALSWVGVVDRTFARVSDAYCKHLTGWKARKAHVGLMLYRETTMKATYLKVSGWETRKLFTNSGYRCTFQFTRRIATDKQVVSAVKTYTYVRTCR